MNLTSWSRASAGTSKAALTTYLEALRNRCARYGVNVVTIKPGYVETELTSDWLGGEGGQKYLQKFPRRRVMDENSLDEALLFLCSDASKFVTGTDVLVDDAQSMA